MIALLRILGYLWALPATLIGLALAPLYGFRVPDWRNGALEVTADRLIPSRAAAQTWGWLIYYRGDARGARWRRHEGVHVRQWLVLGLLYLPAYAALFAWHFLFDATGGDPSDPRWERAYRRIWFERVAFQAEDG